MGCKITVCTSVSPVSERKNGRTVGPLASTKSCCYVVNPPLLGVTNRTTVAFSSRVRVVGLTHESKKARRLVERSDLIISVQCSLVRLPDQFEVNQHICHS